MLASSMGFVDDERSGMASEVLDTLSGEGVNKGGRWDGVVVKALEVVHAERISALRRMVEHDMVN